MMKSSCHTHYMSKCVFATQQETERLKMAGKRKVNQVGKESEKDALVIINCQDISSFLSCRCMIVAVTYTLE